MTTAHTLIALISSLSLSTTYPTASYIHPLIFLSDAWNSTNLKVTQLLLFSRQVTSESFSPHELQHARLPCPSLSPKVCSNSCPLSQWYYFCLNLCHPLLLLPSIFPSIRVSSNELALRLRWPKYWSFSFSISPSNEHYLAQNLSFLLCPFSAKYHHLPSCITKPESWDLSSISH